jgi:hypothetical protein
VLALLVVLGVALLVARGCVDAERNVSSEQAIEIAEKEARFTPERVQVRFVQQGIPPVGVWAVSLSTTDDAGELDRVQVVFVDAKTGEVREP